MSRSQKWKPDRSEAAQEYRRLYATPQWKGLRLQQLNKEPLCRSCEAQGRVTAATVADHIKPHRGDPALFFDPDNLQSLCDEEPWRCHSSAKQSEESLGYSKAIGADGWPIDPSHPANRH
jgi:5-methylcytosine-specific restriction protein A